MERTTGFMLATKPSEWDTEEMKKLNDALNKIGISFDLKTEDTPESRYEKQHHYLMIRYDFDTIYKKLHRNAGARRKQIVGIHKVSDIQERMKTESADHIAAELGISRATLFRRLKEAEEWDSTYL